MVYHMITPRGHPLHLHKKTVGPKPVETLGITLWTTAVQFLTEETSSMTEIEVLDGLFYVHALGVRHYRFVSSFKESAAKLKFQLKYLHKIK